MYRPLIEKGVPLFSGIRTFMHLPYVKELDNVDYAVIGVPFDTGVSYAVGTRFGPASIREMSQRIRPISTAMNIDTSEYLSGIDYGDLKVHPGYIDYSYEAIEEQLNPIFAKGIVPIMLGGDHSISYPHVKAAANTYGPVSLVHFDSHTDTGKSMDERKKHSHGTMFRYAAEEGLINAATSIQIGMRGTPFALNALDESRALGYEVLSTDDAKKLSIPELCERIKQRVGDNPVFLTFDIDFLDPVFAPGTGTPEVGGFTTYEAQQMLRGLAGLNLIGFDLVEVLPDRDLTKVTSLNAANIVFEFITLLALNRRSRKEAESAVLG
ncbi:agmatinase [Paenibacillus ginsengihumi]|uniref:agmatinase n=1 Tax=Paenibacillus ginsengihumi TaxID=431596 RepID=UPI0003755387|nr:agmatinase [Paenibacillus ginsengihumi]